MDMFGAERYRKHHLAKHFEGGTVYQAFLSALFYHRWHSPIEGIIEDIYSIDGTYFLDQSQLIDYDPGSPNNSQSFLTAVAARMVFVIRGENKKIGKVAIIFIGMAEVSSCVATAKIGDEVQKGTQIGHFAYGGSSHAIIFEKKAKLNFAQTLYSTTKDEKTVALRQNINSFLAEVVSHEK
jgi:phosphatidylserine decarboxylase